MRTLLLALMICCPSLTGFGMGVGLNEKAAREKSDIIAHVTIVATSPVATKPSAPTEAAGPKLDSFSRVATARVITPVKGCKEGDTLRLAFDNGYGCPNVSYTPNEECLVFLQKGPDDVYTTMNLYCGRFTVNAGQVSHFYLMHPRGQAPQTLPLTTVLAWLREPPLEKSAD
ncbi:MAG: hypothetical protein H7Y06_11135 [Opitutaceae bacterium]|nr:hypothetical protein [Opitutaceae bacterium]